MHQSKLGCQTWLLALFLIVSNPKGRSSVQLAADLGVTQKTAWAHRIRAALTGDGRSTGRHAHRATGPEDGSSDPVVCRTQKSVSWLESSSLAGQSRPRCSVLVNEVRRSHSLRSRLRTDHRPEHVSPTILSCWDGIVATNNLPEGVSWVSVNSHRPLDMPRWVRRAHVSVEVLSDLIDRVVTFSRHRFLSFIGRFARAGRGTPYGI